MTAGEDQPQPVVGDRRLGNLVDLVIAGDAQGLEALELRQLGVQGPRTPQSIDRPVASDTRDPGAGICGNAVPGPALERDDERLLDRLLGGVEVPEDPDQGRDRTPGLVPEGAVDDPGRRLYDEVSAAAVCGSSYPYCA